MNMVLGYILTILGCFGTFGSVAYIAKDTRYSYTAPFTDHEETVMAVLIISMIVLVAGIMTIIFSVIKSKNQGKLNQLTNANNGLQSGNTCPKCNTNVAENCPVCPKCGHVFENMRR